MFYGYAVTSAKQNPFLSLSPIAPMIQADETLVWFGTNQAALHIARVTLVFKQR
jgi:hypothetical protein